jgi:multiple sugar transport system substrate-binding protein
MADTGTFPALKSILNSKDFTDPDTAANKKVNAYFGGQNVNKILAESAQRKVTKFSYLPYNPYAQSSFGDQISKAYSKDITLKQAFANYGKALTDHGNQQGYTVTDKG